MAAVILNRRIRVHGAENSGGRPRVSRFLTQLAHPGGERLLAGLPAFYRAFDASGELARLLGVFEALLFDGEADARHGLPGIERELHAIPALFAPLGSAARTPAPFVGWLASWLAFTPHALFDEPALRRIAAGIVPLYGLRGTRAYLERLIGLCFDDVGQVRIDDRPRVGFTIGASAIGSDTRLGESFSQRIAARPASLPARVSRPTGEGIVVYM